MQEIVSNFFLLISSVNLTKLKQNKKSYLCITSSLRKCLLFFKESSILIMRLIWRSHLDKEAYIKRVSSCIPILLTNWNSKLSFFL